MSAAVVRCATMGIGRGAAFRQYEDHHARLICDQSWSAAPDKAYFSTACWCRGHKAGRHSAIVQCRLPAANGGGSLPVDHAVSADGTVLTHQTCQSEYAPIASFCWMQDHLHSLIAAHKDSEHVTPPAGAAAPVLKHYKTKQTPSAGAAPTSGQRTPLGVLSASDRNARSHSTQQR
jgi:hypothetical protein